MGEIMRRVWYGGVESGGNRGAVMLLLLNSGGRRRGAISRQILDLFELVYEGGEIAFRGEAEAVNGVGARVGPLAELLRRLGERHRRRHRAVDDRFRTCGRGFGMGERRQKAQKDGEIVRENETRFDKVTNGEMLPRNEMVAKEDDYREVDEISSNDEM